MYDLRYIFSELSEVSEDDFGPEGPFNVRLLERNDLTAKKMRDTESLTCRYNYHGV